MNTVMRKELCHIFSPLYWFHYTIGIVVVFFIQYFSGKFKPLLCNGCSHFKTASEITRPKNVEARARTRLINNLVDRRFNCDNIGYYLNIHGKWNGLYNCYAAHPPLKKEETLLHLLVGLGPSVVAQFAKSCQTLLAHRW